MGSFWTLRHSWIHWSQVKSISINLSGVWDSYAKPLGDPFFGADVDEKPQTCFRAVCRAPSKGCERLWTCWTMGLGVGHCGSAVEEGLRFHGRYIHVGQVKYETQTANGEVWLMIFYSQEFHGFRVFALRVEFELEASANAVPVARVRMEHVDLHPFAPKIWIPCNEYRSEYNHIYIYI